MNCCAMIHEDALRAVVSRFRIERGMVEKGNRTVFRSSIVFIVHDSPTEASSARGGGTGDSRRTCGSPSPRVSSTVSRYEKMGDMRVLDPLDALSQRVKTKVDRTRPYARDLACRLDVPAEGI